MGLAFFLFFPVLNCKINSSNNTAKYNYAHHCIKSFHCYYSLSLGVIKYAKTPNSKIAIANERPAKNVILPVRKLPITPTVKAYLAASAKILATTFLLSLFTLEVYHKKETI